jgi:EmrB/QacA subfamily drug resistance transporter
VTDEAVGETAPEHAADHHRQQRGDGRPLGVPGSPVPSGHGAGRDARLLSATMVGVASGAILVPLNSTMLAVALPSVMSTFAVPPDAAATLVTVYLGAVAIAVPVGGSVGDRFGHRRTFLVGVAGFGLASLVAALAPAFGVLVVARILQAVSGALVSTTSVALIRAGSPASRRGAAFGVFDMLVSTSAALGPVLGGLIVGAFDWRVMFVLAAPIAVVAILAVGLRPDPMTAAAEGGQPSGLSAPRPIDGRGLAVLAVLLVALLLALRGGRDGPIDTLAAIAVPLILVAFVRLELRTEHPAVDPRLFANRTFAAAVAGVFLATVVLHATLVLVPLLVEVLQRGSPESTGVVLLGISALGAIAAPIGGRLSDRIGRRGPALAGSAAALVGLAVLWQVAGTASLLVLGALLALVGAGMGLAGSPRQAAALETVESSRVGMAAGTYYTGRYLGGVVGASLAGAVLGGAVSVSGVAFGFGLLTVAAVGLLVASAGLAGRRA